MDLASVEALEVGPPAIAATSGTAMPTVTITFAAMIVLVMGKMEGIVTLSRTNAFAGKSSKIKKCLNQQKLLIKTSKYGRYGSMIVPSVAECS